MRHWLNCNPGEVPDQVLVETSNMVRSVWLSVAVKMGSRLAIYPTYSRFQKDLNSFASHTQFFIGTQRYKEAKPELTFPSPEEISLDLAARVRARYIRSEIYILTSGRPDHFRPAVLQGMITEVFGKHPWPYTFENALLNDPNRLPILRSAQ